LPSPSRRPKPSGRPEGRSRPCFGKAGQSARLPEGTPSPTGRLASLLCAFRRFLPMLSRLRNMFRVADLRNKILFTLLIIAIYRLGSHLPLPYVDFSAIQALKDRAAQGGALEFLDLFSGGALTNVAVFALGIMPYITSSIIMQLLAVVIPKLEIGRAHV